MEPLRIAAVQMEPGLGETAASGAQIIEWMDRASTAGAQLICFPEASLTGYSAPHAHEAAVTRDDPAVAAVCDAAREMGIAVSFGFMERACDGRIFVAHQVADGKNAAATLFYRKTHLGRSEHDVFSAGDALPVGEAAAAVVGVQLCWESHIPDISTALRAQGAEILLIPFASPLGGDRRRETWQRFLPARAYDNGVFAIAVNALSRERDGSPRGGGIAVYAPDGTVLAESYSPEPGMVVCDLDGRLPRNDRHAGMKGASYFDARRPELYSTTPEQGLPIS